MTAWYKNSYARILIDNHITDNDPSFMTRFDPAVYISMVKKAGVDAAMVYACCHNGNCYYPTQVGYMHPNLSGRDIFGETVKLLRQSGIIPIAYYTTIYHNHSAKNNPGWRMQDINGSQHSGRYWWSCPNNPFYQEFTKKQIEEIIAYDIDGIFIDMTFWPVVCYCTNCRNRYQQDSGLELPTVLDWRNRDWVHFQRFRQRSMATFTRELTQWIKSKRDITVTHQSSPIIAGYMIGQSNGIANSCDYTSGDFYGGKYQHILGAKVLSAATKEHPFEFMTSRCVNLNDHTSMKSEVELRCEAATTLASGGASFFIDAINPDGTLEPGVYDRLGKVTASLTPFYRKLRELRPILYARTGLYFSIVSHVDEKLNGTPIKQLADNPWQYSITPPVEELSGASTILTQMHHPFRLVRDDGYLSGLSTLIINDARFMSHEECERIRKFVYSGGTLLATGLTGIYQLDGTTAGNFLMADVFGVTYTGRMSKRVNYLVFEDNIQPSVLPKTISSNRPSPLVHATTAKILAYIAEPIFDPDDSQRWASIHSNPPGKITEYPALTENAYGQGICIYLAPACLSMQQDAQIQFGTWLVAQYVRQDMLISTNAPTCVEITILQSMTSKTYLLCFVNYQRELPNIPVYDLVSCVKLPKDSRLNNISCVSSGMPMQYHIDNGEINIKIPRLDTLEMIAIEWE